MRSQLRAARLMRRSLPEGQRLLEEIDGLEKGTVSHLSFVFPIRRLQFGRVAADSFIKHERLPGLWAFMASVSISTVFHGRADCPFGTPPRLSTCWGEVAPEAWQTERGSVSV